MAIEAIGYGTIVNYNGYSGDIPYPSSIDEGDILIAYILGNNPLLTVTAPSGWTKYASYAASNTVSYILWKRATGSETGVQQFYQDYMESFACMSNFRGCIAENSPFDSVFNNKSAYGNTLSWDSITPTENNCMILAISGILENYSVGTITGYTELYDQLSDPFGTPDGGLALQYELQTTAAATGNQSCTSSGSAYWQTRHCALLPAVAAGAIDDAIFFGMNF